MYLKIEEATVGLRIKIALPTKWCEVNAPTTHIWLEGKITEVGKKDEHHWIIVKAKSKKYLFGIENLQCFPKDGEYVGIKVLKGKKK